jgi:TolB-like protein
MLRFRTLGGAVVERDGLPLGGPAAQRKPLAVLALLAPAVDRGVSRDKLLAHVWPDIEPDRAGHRLTQVLYALRRDLAADDLFLGSTELRLNPKRITSDVDDFTAARRVGDLERAVGLYGGPFLDGFFLSGAVEFEQWVENERTGFAREYAEALETLAATAATRGDHRTAAEWWRALADHDPLSSRTTVHLMTALAAAGRRADAIERARSYQEMIQRELEAAPNPAVLSLADELRQRPSTLQDGEGIRAEDISIAVLPFAGSAAGPAHDSFADGLADELMSGLARLNAVRVAARVSVATFRGSDLDAREIGRRLQVQALLEGSVRQADDRVRLTARLVDVRNGWQVWSQIYERQVKDTFAAQDELASLIVKEVDRELARLRASRAMPHG